VFDPDEEEFKLQYIDTQDNSDSSSSSEGEDDSESDEASEAGQEKAESEESGVGEPPPEAEAPAAPAPDEAFEPVDSLQLQQQPVWQLSPYLLSKFDAAEVGGGINHFLVEGEAGTGQLGWLLVWNCAAQLSYPGCCCSTESDGGGLLYSQ
jgi:hypothetical protein